MADSVAGGGEARRGGSMPQIVCLLPYAHDGQLPVAEPHHSSSWCPLQLAARFPAEQPHHRASHRLLRLWDAGKKKPKTSAFFSTWVFFLEFSSLVFLPLVRRCCGCMATTSHGSRVEPSVTSGCWKSSIWAITRCSDWKVGHSGAWRSCRACTCIAASWPLSPTTSSTSCTACSSFTCR